jgi:uncharacterized protein YecE (DUF72 family)
LSDQIRIGTSGYSYPGPPPKGWYGSFYPEAKSKQFDELTYYSSFFDAVEINSTFYRPPSPSMAGARTRKTPARFEFAIKAWQKFTHADKIGGATAGSKESWESSTSADVDLFRRSIGPLTEAGKLGVLLFQFPPRFHFTAENGERLSWLLRAFEDYPKAIELRHRSWSDRSKETKVLLDQAGAVWTVIDEPKFDSSVKQEYEPLGEIFYLRLHGRNREKWWRHQEAWERYDYLYRPEEIRFFADRTREIAQSSPWTKIYAFFNNHARGQAVANGLMLAHALGLNISRPVPRSLVEAFPQLAEIRPCS